MVALASWSGVFSGALPLSLLSTHLQKSNCTDDIYFVVFFFSFLFSFQRVIEYAGGYNGAIATSEAYLYCLDSLPLVICMSAYVWFYPGRYLPDHVNSVSYGSDIEAGTPGSHEMLNSKGAQ